MGLASGTNSLQTTILRSTLGYNKLFFTFGMLGQVASEVTWTLLNKMDRSALSASSRIDRIILDSRNKSKDAEVKNEDKVAIVTGANSGIGFETAKALGRAGFHTILACRSEDRAKEAIETLKRQTGLEDRFEFMRLDLASLESVDAFVEEFKKRGTPLDVLVNNAGVMMISYAENPNGIESQLGTNHVGHFALTMGLLDSLKAAKQGARVVVVSSLAASFVQEIDYERFGRRQTWYDSYDNYSMSKLASTTFANTLARKLASSGVTVNSLHPGMVTTNITRHVGTSSIQHAVESMILLDVQAGALTSIYLALSPEVEGETGHYFTRCMQMAAHPKSLDVAEQDKLWEYTEKLIAEKTK
ncbi:NAD(P)-binding protein [Martensiomyces pterosporus]|nr:NAD(P)-binding protein [Martensiomyces pterosporus]